MKRDATELEQPASKKRHVSPDKPSATATATATEPAPALTAAFRPDLFHPDTRTSIQAQYNASHPFPHAVVPSLIQESLLRAVRGEIIDHIHFTLKETDIYRIHQSGDLANLSNLDAASLQHLPSLVRLRDALYSADFREWISSVTGAGKVSGTKTDMAVMVYTPGSYLLCHDDVIGSRRVSYILYLTDPDRPWQAEWGGGLRLFPTEDRQSAAGEAIKVPLSGHSVNIPPSAGQLSFFAVRPGESYHDVEEVYHGSSPDQDQGRVRMAISGWFHVPQEGEDGFEQGMEQSRAQLSSLAQLKGAANDFDEPQAAFRHYDEPRAVMDSHASQQEIDPGEDQDPSDDELTEQDLTFLLRYLSPSYLTPDMIEDFASSFVEVSALQLDQFFNPMFADKLHRYITEAEGDGDKPQPFLTPSHPINWPVARPPHKHRYTFLQSTEALHKDPTPISRLLTDLIHSHAFQKWLALVTGLKTTDLVRQHALARRFRRGQDYALASHLQGEQAQLEFTISITPSGGWADAGPDEGGPESDGPGHLAEPDVDPGSETLAHGGGPNGHEEGRSVAGVRFSAPLTVDVGGEEVYMAGEDDEPGDAAGQGKQSDPAIYRSSAVGEDGEEDEDGILFTNPPGWNRFSVVLRDKGTLRFVKYVSRAAKGDRWDIKGEIEIGNDAWADGQSDHE